MKHDRFLIHVLGICILTWPAAAWSQEKDAAAKSPSTQAASAAPSEAEKIATLRRKIEEGEKQLRALEAKLESPESDYAKAEKAFQELDDQIQEKEKRLDKLRDDDKTGQAAELEKEIADLRKPWQVAKDRFDLAIQERRTLQEQVATFKQRLQKDKEALEALLSPAEAKPPASPPPIQPAPDAPSQPPPAETDQPAEASPMPPGPAGAAMTAATTTQPAAAPSEEKPKPVDPALIKAQQEAEAKKSEAAKAEAEVQSINERLEQLGKLIELERKLLATAKQKLDNARESEHLHSDQARKLSVEGAPKAEVQAAWEEVAGARNRIREVRAEVESRQERIDELQVERAELQAEQIAALEQAETKKQEAEAAQKAVEKIGNPFSPRNIWRWCLQHGPRLLGIIVGVMALLWLVHVLDKRLVKLMAGRPDEGGFVERENRAKTLVSVFHNAANVVVVVGGGLMALAEIDVNIIPLMGGVAVVGLAVAFGAQNLIRDFFSGFMILLENQYGINDVVKIGSISGLVERITLRVTVLRDLEGIAHFIPNGEITSVSNMTHGWSRVLLDIGVSYNEDVDQVMDVLMELAHELRREDDFKRLIIGEPEMLGVDAFGDSAVVIRMIIKTRPLQQWAIKRAMLRRIKKRFDELGIEIPYPHRTVYHRYENGAGPDGGQLTSEANLAARPQETP